MGWGLGDLSSEGEMYWEICAGAHRVPGYATVDVAGLPV